jgi:hypothetical protein
VPQTVDYKCFTRAHFKGAQICEGKPATIAVSTGQCVPTRYGGVVWWFEETVPLGFLKGELSTVSPGVNK